MNDDETVREARKKSQEIKQRWDDFEVKDSVQARQDVYDLVRIIDEMSTIYFASW